MSSSISAAQVLEVTQANFRETVVDDTTPILLDFWAPWCGPCRMMKPHLAEAAGLLADECRVGSVNIDENAELAGLFGVQSIPTLAVVRDRRVIAGWLGVVPAGELATRVRQSLAAPDPE